MKTSSCPDCGPVPVNHFAERFSVIVNQFIETYLKPFGYIRKSLAPVFHSFDLERLGLSSIKILVKIRVIKILHNPHVLDSSRTRTLWEAAKKRGIKMYKLGLFGRPTELTVAELNGKSRVFMSLPRLKGPASESFQWMDNKAIMKERFRSAQIPVALGRVARSKKQAIEIFSSLSKPVIVKPILGSRGRHTTIQVTSQSELLTAFNKAKQLSPWVIVEQQLSGFVFRPTVIDGKVVAVARKEPAHVVGNGSSTVLELVNQENKNPLRQGPIFHHLVIDSAVEQELKRQNLTLMSIPALGQFVVLGQKTGRGSGGSITDVTDIVHSDNVRLFEKVAQVLGDPLVGIDFIIQDIARPWHEQPLSGVIECNSLPFIDVHHYPLFGQPRDAAGALWELIFPLEG